MGQFVSFYKILERKIGLGIEKIKLPAVKALRRLRPKIKNVTCPEPLLGR